MKNTTLHIHKQTTATRVFMPLLVLLSLSIGSLAQPVASDSMPMAKPLFKFLKMDELQLPTALKSFKIGGYYRFQGYYRNQTTKLIDDGSAGAAMYAGDLYREPLMLLYLGGSPIDKVNFGADLFVTNTYYYGITKGRSLDGDSISLNLGGSVSASIKTNAGDFSAQGGGIIWYSLSPFTLGTYQNVYNRFSIYERNPWEPVRKGAAKYRTFYNEGRIMQDTRWARQAFQGVVLEGNNLPWKLNVSMIYGKTINNGGGSSFLNRNTPNLAVGGRIRKDLDNGYISLNTFNNSYLTLGSSVNPNNRMDTLFSTNTTKYSVHSLEFLYNLADINFSGEFGLGNYSSPQYKLDWSPAVALRMKLPAKYTLIPLEISGYSVGKNFVNINSTFINTTVLDSATSGQNRNAAGQAPGSLFPSASPILDIGQYANNRRGLELNTSFNLGDNVKIAIGNSFAGEIERSGKNISYGHRVNGLAISRIYNFSWMPTTYGPYNNLSSIFRGYYEQVRISDTLADGSAAKLKYFNNIEVHTKIRTQFIGRALYFNYLGAYNSVQNYFSPVTVFNPSALLRVYYHEFETFYQLFPRFVLCGYFGLERAIGNNETNLGDVQQANGGYLPRNQTTTGYGIGFDWDIFSNMGLYFRQRWFEHSDPNFAKDRYKGYEATVELKIFFD